MRKVEEETPRNDKPSKTSRIETDKPSGATEISVNEEGSQLRKCIKCDTPLDPIQCGYCGWIHIEDTRNDKSSERKATANRLVANRSSDEHASETVAMKEESQLRLKEGENYLPYEDDSQIVHSILNSKVWCPECEEYIQDLKDLRGEE